MSTSEESVVSVWEVRSRCTRGRHRVRSFCRKSRLSAWASWLQLSCVVREEEEENVAEEEQA